MAVTTIFFYIFILVYKGEGNTLTMNWNCYEGVKAEGDHQCFYIFILVSKGEGNTLILGLCIKPRSLKVLKSKAKVLHQKQPYKWGCCTPAYQQQK